MKTDELRKAYLDFFRSKEHKVFSSDSLVPHDDPSLLFTGAGMNQFKSYFLGLKKDVKRASSCQKCLRTADLDRVGKTGYHHSFFEMLGNFSFGDYFKEEAIAWGWEFVTKTLLLPKDKLWVSVYEEDDEAFNIWKNRIGLPEARIVRMGPEDNFWPANAPKEGPNGPCGPCSEIYVGAVAGKGVEIWNLVFTQFDRQSDGSLKPLPQKNIDTGMGLERTAAVLQGVESNFDTDNFQRIRAALKKLLAKKNKEEKAHENAVMDHLRAVVFSIADGALPSNEGRGYVIRKLIRLASDHLQKAGAEKAGLLSALVPAIVEVYGQVYPEIMDKQKTIISIVENEENSYLEVLRIQVPKMREALMQVKNSADPTTWASKIAGHAFKFYDTFGLPLDIIRNAAAEIGLKLDDAEFNKHLNEQKQRSRESSKIAGEIFKRNELLALIEGVAPTQFQGYGGLGAEGKLVRILHGQESAKKISSGEMGFLIFDRTPFYAESGGQIGDTGTIEGDGFQADVLDTQVLEKCVLHKVLVKKGAAEPGKNYKLSVLEERRSDVMKNHTATHLLHAALRKVLGEHVKQSGSLVAPDYLRFDFTHFKAMDPESIAAVEGLVNQEIQKNTVLDKTVMAKEAAVKQGAVAFFGEKYGEEVRVVTIGDFSKELCGGTHLHSTGQIELFKIISEGSIQAGVRRIEAVTGRWAKQLLSEQRAEIESMMNDLGVSENNFQESIKKLNEKIAILKNRLESARNEKIKFKIARDFKAAEKIGTVTYLKESIPGTDVETLKVACDYLKNMSVPYIALMVSGSIDKTSFVVAGSGDMVQRGFHSEQIVKQISSVIGGNGGGRPEFAVGGLKSAYGDSAVQILQVGTGNITTFIINNLKK